MKPLLLSRIFAIGALIVMLSACKEDEIIIPDNQNPPDNTIEEATIINYINRVYITALGREPSTTEEADANLLVSTTKFTEADRSALVGSVLSKNEFLANIYDIARVEFLNNADTFTIRQEIRQLENAKLTDTTLTPEEIGFIDNQIKEFEDLQNSYIDLIFNNMTIAEMYRRVSDNGIYNEINMGTENFVTSTFQNYILRYPSLSELEEGKNMVDGFQASLFLQVGKNKDDYFDIFFGSDDYYAGQVKYLFQKYLFREPNSEEMQHFSDIYKNSDNYVDLAKEIMVLEEFAGL